MQKLIFFKVKPKEPYWDLKWFCLLCKSPNNSCEQHHYVCFKDPQALARVRHVSSLPVPTTKFPDSGVTWKFALAGMTKAFKNQATAGSSKPSHLTIFLGPTAKEKSLDGRILGPRRESDHMRLQTYQSMTAK